MELPSLDMWGHEEVDPNSSDTPEEAGRRSSIFNRYAEAFVLAVREPSYSNSAKEERKPPMMEDFAFTGIGLAVLADVQFKSRSSADFDSHFAASQMRLREIQNAQVQRLRDRVIQELKQVLERIRLSLEEYYTTDAERVVESPDQDQKETQKREKRREPRRKTRKKMRAREKEKQQKKQDKDKLEQEEKQDLTGFEPGSLEQAKEQELTRKDINQQATVSNKENGDGVIPSETSDSSEDDEGGDGEENGEQSNDIDDEDNDVKEGGTARRQVSNTLLNRRAKRRKILKLIDSYLEVCNEREDIIRQMQFWMDSTVDESLEGSGPAPPFSPSLLAEKLSLDIASDVDTFGGNLKRLKDISDSLGIGEGDNVLDDNQGKKLPPGRAPRAAVIFNEEELSVAENFLQATKGIQKCFEESIKSTPVRRIRINLGNSMKQFKYICIAMEKRGEEIRQFDEKVNELDEEVSKMKKANEELKKRTKKAQVNAEKFEHQNKTLQNKVKEQQKNIDELKEELEEYKQRESHSPQGSSNESIASFRRSRESVSVVGLVTKPSESLAPTGEKVTIKTPKASRVQIVLPGEKSSDSEETSKEIQELKKRLDTAAEELKIEKEKSGAFEQEFLALQSDKVKVEEERSDLEIQLEDMRRENERVVEELTKKLEDEERKTKKMSLEIECNEEMIKYQEERLHQFMEEIQAMEERIMSLPSTPATMSIASMAGPARRERRKTSLQLGLEPQTARQMVAKVKQQYEEEIQSLKEHMAKENQRHQAEIRRTEQEHKKDIQNIHKESMLLLRALNRFKECVAALLDREHLGQEAHSIRSLAPLPLDEKFGDTRQMLARMAILSNEMLTSLELQLSRGLMSKRLEIKDTTLSKTFTQMDLDSQSEALRKAKDLGTLQAGKLKARREEMLGQHNEHVIKKLLEEGRRREVMERVKELLALNSGLEKEFRITKKNSEEAMHKKEMQLKKVIQREIDARRIVEQQKIIIKSLASIWKSRRIGQKFIRRDDQLRNLELLEEAMTENEISKSLYESTRKLIVEAMQFPRKRFIELVKKYTHFRRIKEIKDNVAKMKMESNVSENVLLAMKEAEERMLRQKELWRQKKDLFWQARAEALEKLCEIIAKVQEETGILLTKPIELIPRLEDIKEDIKEIDEEDIREAMNIPKERAKLRKALAQMEARTTAAAVGDRPPSALDGMAMPPEETQGPLWKTIGSLPAAMVTTPRLLDLDINRNRLAAQNLLDHVRRGPWDSETVSLPPLSFFPYCGARLFGQLRKTRSEPMRRKKVAKTIRSAVLPPIASLYPENEVS